MDGGWMKNYMVFFSKNSLDLQTFKYNNTNFQADTNILKDCRLISSYSTYVILAQEKISSTYFEVNVLTTFQIRF